MGLRDRLQSTARRLLGGQPAAPDKGPSFPREASPDGLVPTLWDHEVGYDRAVPCTLPDGAPGVAVCCRKGVYALRGVDPDARFDPASFELVSRGRAWSVFTGEGRGAPDATPYAARSFGAVTWIGGPCAPPSVVEQVAVSLDPLGLTIPAGVFPPSRLAFRDVKLGEGEGVAPDSVFEADYMGALWSSGRVFDSTWRRRRRYRVDMAAPNLLQGWRQGLLGLRPGGLRLIIVPPWLGYGEEEIEETVPSGDTLLFLVQR